ncbi:hypothetical protein ACRCUN_12320 [Mycobacterium sp. LTG2003]
MKHLLLTALAAGALGASLGLGAPAGAAPTGPSSAEDAIGQLRAQGFDVVVNRIGSGTSDRCVITAVRPGHTFSRTDSGVPGAGDDLVTTVIGRTLYVDLTC